MSTSVEGADLLPIAISALEHWSYCPRQCGLIHLEQTFDENYYTLRGRLAHTRSDTGRHSTEHGTRITRDVQIWSTRLGLRGKVDTLEFHAGVPYPVEYKSGSIRDWQHDAIQVCAQALCLEEMLGVSIPRGAIAYLASHRRREVTFTPVLRAAVAAAATAIRQMLTDQRLPPAVHDPRCNHCSLQDSCLPAVLVDRPRARRHLATVFRVAGPDEEL